MDTYCKTSDEAFYATADQMSSTCEIDRNYTQAASGKMSSVTTSVADFIVAERNIQKAAADLDAERIERIKGETQGYCATDKLVILGTADPTRGQAPYKDKEYTIWAVAVAATYPDVERIDALFELHTSGYWEQDPNVKKRLAETTIPIYMHEKVEDIPASVPFPIDEVTQYRRYYTSSIALMEGLAFHSFMTTGKPKEVELFGIHMAAGEEYTDQRPCCEYWLGRMESAGMKVTLAPGGALLAAKGIYGFEDYNPTCWEMQQRVFAIQGGVKQSDGEIQRWTIQKAKNEGALFETEHWLRKAQRGEI